MAQRLRLAHLVEQGVAGDAETLPRVQFRHQVVIVRVEPLGHLARRRRGAARRAAPGHPEHGVQRHGRVAGLAETRGHRAQRGRPLQHVVVPGEVAHRHQIHSGRGLDRPMAGAQRASRLLQLLLRGQPGPMAFQGALEFAAHADAGKAQVVQSSHVRVASDSIYETRHCARRAA
ncbi:MAG: hypothetical protein ABT00_02480 [Bordetella sp. SCN 68-11]|nr:MAG: hypothetical protein ABT00_02480 [Bordetella sp. SCN 68-11]